MHPEGRELFLRGGRLPPGFTSAQTGIEKGLLRFFGSAIFADYDLMAIARSNLSGEWLPTSKTQHRELFAKVEPIPKQGLKVPMIQHPTEFMWIGGIGARELEWVFWFGPGRRFHRGPSSMPEVAIKARSGIEDWRGTRRPARAADRHSGGVLG